MDPNPANNNPTTDDPNSAASNPSSMGLPPIQPSVDHNPQPPTTNSEMANDLGSQAVGQQTSGVPIPSVTNNNQSMGSNYAASTANQAASGEVEPLTANQTASNDIMSPPQTPTVNQSSSVENTMPGNPDVGNMNSVPEAMAGPVPVPGAQPNPAQQPLATGSSSKSSGKGFWLILGGLVFLLIILGVILIVL